MCMWPSGTDVSPLLCGHRHRFESHLGYISTFRCFGFNSHNVHHSIHAIIVANSGSPSTGVDVNILRHPLHSVEVAGRITGGGPLAGGVRLPHHNILYLAGNIRELQLKPIQLFGTWHLAHITMTRGLGCEWKSCHA